MTKATKPDATGQAGNIPVSSINPLIDNDYRETLGNVAAVLEFIAGWAEECGISEGPAFPLERGAQGLQQILSTAVAALDYSADRVGGAE